MFNENGLECEHNGQTIGAIVQSGERSNRKQFNNSVLFKYTENNGKADYVFRGWIEIDWNEYRKQQPDEHLINALIANDAIMLQGRIVTGGTGVTKSEWKTKAQALFELNLMYQAGDITKEEFNTRFDAFKAD